MKSLSIFLVFASLICIPASAADNSSLHFLVGTWHCTYDAGKTRSTYRATFAYEMNGGWIREVDSWSGGGGDQGMIAYNPEHGWTAVVLGPGATTTVFRASGTNSNRIAYRSVYPDASMTDVFERSSPTSYTLRFTQSKNGKTASSHDTCTKT
jgi:hypothetical protein